MDPTTKELKLDLSSFVCTDESYVTTTNEFFTFFYKGSSVDEMLDDYFTNRSSEDVDLLVSTSEDMTHGETKALISVSDKFYHFFVDSLPFILKIHKLDPGVRFILYLQRAVYRPGYEDMLRLLFSILDGEGIKYSTISTVPDRPLAPVYRFKNYILIDENNVGVHNFLSLEDVKYAANTAIEYAIPNGEHEEYYKRAPNRKVYLTLNNRVTYTHGIPKDYEYYTDDARMNDEHKLAGYFKDKGYEVIDPEKNFTSIRQQIAYMTQVKTLVSLTSSGLTNMIFMRPNQTVIEIEAELVQNLLNDSAQEHLVQRLHPYYQVLSYMKDHLFVSIPSRRNPDEVIEVLSSDRIANII